MLFSVFRVKFSQSASFPEILPFLVGAVYHRQRQANVLDKYEVICSLSNGDIFNDLNGPLI